jgi:hypothetical protein
VNYSLATLRPEINASSFLCALCALCSSKKTYFLGGKGVRIKN